MVIPDITDTYSFIITGYFVGSGSSVSSFGGKKPSEKQSMLLNTNACSPIQTAMWLIKKNNSSQLRDLSPKAGLYEYEEPDV